MTNSKSAAKRVRQNERRRLRNQSYKSMVKTLTKRAQQAIEVDTGDETVAAIRRAIGKIDSAASKGILHRNTAARRKSRLMARYNKALTSDEAEA